MLYNIINNNNYISVLDIQLWMMQLQLCGTTFRTISELKTVSTTLKVWFSPGMAQYVVVLHADNIFSFLFYF